MRHPSVPTVHMSNPTMYLTYTYIWYPVFCLLSLDMIYLLWQHQNPCQQHCHPVNNICKQFWYHHNNYYIIMGNSTFKRTFHSHLDPDEIQTESKRSLLRCLCHSSFLWRPTVSILLYTYIIIGGWCQCCGFNSPCGRNYFQSHLFSKIIYNMVVSTIYTVICYLECDMKSGLSGLFVWRLTC